MGRAREPLYSLTVLAAFSRHREALDWAVAKFTERYGPIQSMSADLPFHHTRYYEKTMGGELRKRFVVFEPFADPASLPEIKHFAIGLEHALAETGKFPEERPLNLDPGFLQLGKFELATTKDQSHRIYLRDQIFAEVTLRFCLGKFEAWPWTYADYREPAVIEFLEKARAWLYARVLDARSQRQTMPEMS